jgi:hypothetical protein
MRGAMQRFDQRHVRTDVPAAGTQVRAAFERDEYAGHRQLSGTLQGLSQPVSGALTYSRYNHVARSAEHGLLLKLGQAGD